MKKIMTVIYVVLVAVNIVIFIYSGYLSDVARKKQAKGMEYQVNIIHKIDTLLSNEVLVLHNNICIDDAVKIKTSIPKVFTDISRIEEASQQYQKVFNIILVLTLLTILSGLSIGFEI